MCSVCDDLGQWVCDCSRIVPIGEACVCGSVRADTYVPCISIFIGSEFGNREQRRKKKRRKS